MAFQITETSLDGVLIIEPKVFADQRGFFLETFNHQRYCEKGLDCQFVQDNHSRSCRGTLRGLHYQLQNPQGKLVYVVSGEIFDVAVDIRLGSSTYGKWIGQLLSHENHKQFFIPEGFAHGFYVLSGTADVIYKCTNPYTHGDDYEILWSDETIGIDWPILNGQPLLSEKDRNAPTLNNAPAHLLPIYNKNDNQ